MYEYYFTRNIKDIKTQSDIIDFMANQNKWLREQIRIRDDPLFRHANYILSQYDGLLEGYNDATKNRQPKDDVCFFSGFKNILFFFHFFS